MHDLQVADRGEITSNLLISSSRVRFLWSHYICNETGCQSHQPAPVKASTFLVMYSRYLVKKKNGMPFQSSAAFAASHDSPVVGELHAMYAWHQSTVSIAFRLYRMQDEGLLAPMSFVARCMTRLGCMRKHPRIGS